MANEILRRVIEEGNRLARIDAEENRQQRAREENRIFHRLVNDGKLYEDIKSAVRAGKTYVRYTHADLELPEEITLDVVVRAISGVEGIEVFRNVESDVSIHWKEQQ